MSNLPLIFTDLETTGLDPNKHEIIEIAALRVDPETLEIQEQWEAKVKPEHIESADPQALRVNGYSEDAWRDAYPLEEAIADYTKRAQGGVLAAFNLYMDWSFLERAFAKTAVLSAKYGVSGPFADYHFLDVLSFAYAKLRDKIPLERMTLKNMATELGIEIKEHHRAMADTIAAYEIYKRLTIKSGI